MATRCRIGLELPAGQVVSVYCHWDGYPEFVGKRLAENYITRDVVKKLIDGGDISSIDSNSSWDDMALDENIVLYYRDRGDEDVDPILHDSVDDYLHATDVVGGEYAYLFTEDRGWIYFEVPGDIEQESEEKAFFKHSFN
jgi:hypothetical protein